MISYFLLQCKLHENTTFESIVRDRKHHTQQSWGAAAGTSLCARWLRSSPELQMLRRQSASTNLFFLFPVFLVFFFFSNFQTSSSSSFVAASRPRQHRCSRLAAPMSEKKMPEPPGTYRCHCDVLWHLHPSHLKVLSIWLLFDIVNSKWGAAAEGEMAGGSYETWLHKIWYDSDILDAAPVRFCISWLRRLWRQQGSNGPWCSRRVESCWPEHPIALSHDLSVPSLQSVQSSCCSCFKSGCRRFRKTEQLAKTRRLHRGSCQVGRRPSKTVFLFDKIVVHLAQSKCESGIVKGEFWTIQNHHLPTTQGSFLSLGWGSNPRNSHWTHDRWKAERLRCKILGRGCPWTAWLVGLPWFTSTLCGGGLPQKMRFLFQNSWCLDMSRPLANRRFNHFFFPEIPLQTWTPGFTSRVS